jgi:hypothetical protein
VQIYFSRYHKPVRIHGISGILLILVLLALFGRRR